MSIYARNLGVREPNVSELRRRLSKPEEVETPPFATFRFEALGVGLAVGEQGWLHEVAAFAKPFSPIARPSPMPLLALNQRTHCHRASLAAHTPKSSASWRNGYAEDRKSSYEGSIPFRGLHSTTRAPKSARPLSSPHGLTTNVRFTPPRLTGRSRASRSGGAAVPRRPDPPSPAGPRPAPISPARASR
jgi:hypothetical protein